METESRELRLELSAIEERLRVTEREKGDMERRGVELETKVMSVLFSHYNKKNVFS